MLGIQPFIAVDCRCNFSKQLDLLPSDWGGKKKTKNISSKFLAYLSHSDKGKLKNKTGGAFPHGNTKPPPRKEK